MMETLFKAKYGRNHRGMSLAILPFTYSIIALTSGCAVQTSYRTFTKHSRKVWRAEVQYPVFKGAEHQKQLNRLVLDNAHLRLNNWVKGGGNFANTWTNRVNIYQKKVRYSFAAPYLISFVSGVMTDTGGAHPGYAFDVQNLALIRNKWREVKAKDFFKNGSDWLKEIRSAVVPKLKDKGAEFLWDGTVKTLPAEDAQSFVLTMTGFRFYINPYDVGPWAQGSFIVNVKYSELPDLDQKGILVGSFRK